MHKASWNILLVRRINPASENIVPLAGKEALVWFFVKCWGVDTFAIFQPIDARCVLSSFHNSRGDVNGVFVGEWIVQPPGCIVQGICQGRRQGQEEKRGWEAKKEQFSQVSVVGEKEQLS